MRDRGEGSECYELEPVSMCFSCLLKRCRANNVKAGGKCQINILVDASTRGFPAAH